MGNLGSGVFHSLGAFGDLGRGGNPGNKGETLTGAGGRLSTFDVGVTGGDTLGAIILGGGISFGLGFTRIPGGSNFLIRFDSLRCCPSDPLPSASSSFCLSFLFSGSWLITNQITNYIANRGSGPFLTLNTDR